MQCTEKQNNVKFSSLMAYYKKQEYCVSLRKISGFLIYPRWRCDVDWVNLKVGKRRIRKTLEYLIWIISNKNYMLLFLIVDGIIIQISSQFVELSVPLVHDIFQEIHFRSTVIDFLKNH